MVHIVLLSKLIKKRAGTLPVHRATFGMRKRFKKNSGSLLHLLKFHLATLRSSEAG